MHKNLFVIVVVSLLSLAGGCGQKGPLILPEDDVPAKAETKKKSND